MFEIFQDMQDIAEEETGVVDMCRRWCIADVLGQFLFLQYIFTCCTMTLISTLFTYFSSLLQWPYVFDRTVPNLRVWRQHLNLLVTLFDTAGCNEDWHM
jgi:hypothetical protein